MVGWNGETMWSDLGWLEVLAGSRRNTFFDAGVSSLPGIPHHQG
jgi:hypothetical protein